METVQLLGKRVGIQLAMPVQSRTQQAPHRKLYMICMAARLHAIHDDQDGEKKQRAYLYKRGLTDDVLKHFQIGLAPAEEPISLPTFIWQVWGKDLLDSGLFTCQMAISFMILFGRIIFPLTNDKGQVCFSGRITRLKLTVRL